MARNEQDREDLLREAVALVPRIELAVATFAEPIVVGFRRDGAISFYFGADPVFQFNNASELRRGYRNGYLLKADQGSLAEMRRNRTDSEVQLVRRDLNADEMREVLDEVAERLDRLARSLRESTFTIIGQVPADGDVTRRIRDWLATRPAAIRIALRPNVKKDGIHDH